MLHLKVWTMNHFSWLGLLYYEVNLDFFSLYIFVCVSFPHWEYEQVKNLDVLKQISLFTASS